MLVIVGTQGPRYEAYTAVGDFQAILDERGLQQ